MKITRIQLMTAAAVLSAAVFVSVGAQEQPNLTSLRGNNDLTNLSDSPEINRWQDDRAPIMRDHSQQPPLIPHSIDGYKITVNQNKCLTCHSWDNYQDAGATKISQSHFSDRESNVMGSVAARRYFCVQCHVSQTSAKPLVENNFGRVKNTK